MAESTTTAEHQETHRLVLQRVQPALLGLMDGSVSTLAPLFAAAELTHRPMAAFYVGLSASLGAAISMGLAEALSDDGVISGRGNPWTRGLITGLGTVLGGMFHTFPFLIPDLRLALTVAYVVVGVELVAIAYIRRHYMQSPLGRTLIQVVFGGALVFAIGVVLGNAGG
jgi:erythrin-vacuolar iron transport family protein